MLRELGLPISSAKFSKTEANKPYIITVRYFISVFSKPRHRRRSCLNQVSCFVETDQNLTSFLHPHKLAHCASFAVCSSPDVTLSNVLSWDGVTINITTIPVVAAQPITDLPEHDQLPMGYNVTHDAGLIAMAFEVGTASDQAWIDPPAHRIGVDAMHLSIPDRFTFQAFVETVGDAVRTKPFSPFSLFTSRSAFFPLFRDRVPIPPPSHFSRFSETWNT